MLTNTLVSLFERDLKKLITEIELYENESNIWRIEKKILNSAGNLTLHLIGNLNTYIGKEIGKTNYVRNRDLEFLEKNVPRKDLITKIEDTIETIRLALSQIADEELDSEYPILVFSKKTSTEFFLIHLTTHLAYHLGQINYHRRLIES
ncbi:MULTISPECIES: DUF1572 family protein [Sphingobacterium]|jgi:hypothetical protein|uniref:DUF1572 family protein n=1 Tax=Sphingobacterium kitahiroshimense TaxID=470446 RepID=A0ABV0BUY0_9SPHI|nr:MULTISPECIES: DUF1572 family protein [Sphingobacterium]KKX51096.1 hypothetical protein L950_0206935 [Sphingobacterium sp. IITKGP-BTPF85]MBB2950361.1 hypothetical protein [Sphingobacterium sp. JUb56]MCW2258882.1 hypothetical protein [Sphingobacterium kitahiroshimense]NJI73012.1 DinB family protein [Sphingobacterium sp. B16(2022)]TCR14665.1 uncharacterized protein DUF1572 [Sphingobacterium sp. JUb78]